ncbi:packaged DNA stabilization protein [Terriglobus sp. 2YAB30_2]|uniref:hypothetical protein n=2 Tax=unclassified Terriglobus TaxID=2628988 RepID=UPI003F98F859
MQLKGFVSGAYKLQSTNINCQRCVNLYPQLDESGTGKNVASLLGTPGLKTFATLDAGEHPVRGMLTTSKDGRLFAVTSTTLWEVMSDGTSISRGTLNSSAGFVGIADNGGQLMLVDGPNGYTYDLAANTLTSLADFEANGGGSTVTFLDGYFLFTRPRSQVFVITQPYSTDIDWTMFASAESSPDGLLVALADKELLWLFGTSSVEVWYDSGDATFPFQRTQGGVIQFGLAAARTPVRLANTIAWLGKNEQGQGIVYMANGLAPQRISTHAIEQDLATYSTIADATGYSYQQEGHEFYVLNFPSGNKTWAYDVSTQLWHERAYTGARSLERHRGEMHVEAFGKHILSDYATGKLYILDRFSLNDAGTRITRIRSTPFVSDELKNIFFSKFWLDMEVGLGADGVPIGTPEPQLMLRWSDDGGHKWSGEYWRGLGARGDTYKRVMWWRLGRTRQRVFEIKITDDVLVAINDAFIEMKGGVS